MRKIISKNRHKAYRVPDRGTKHKMDQEIAMAKPQARKEEKSRGKGKSFQNLIVRKGTQGNSTFFGNTLKDGRKTSKMWDTPVYFPGAFLERSECVV